LVEVQEPRSAGGEAGGGRGLGTLIISAARMTHLPETAQVNMLTPGDKSRNKPVALPELYIMQVHPLLRHPDRLLVIRAANGSAV
jgi:hypothetical protein